MSWDLTVIGLALDILGFGLVFAFGGFEVGRAAFLLESSKSHPYLKWSGAFLVIAGFAFQIAGAMGN